MRIDQVKAVIVERVHVTRQQVALAKASLVGQLKSRPATGIDTNILIDAFLREMRATPPERIHLTPSTDAETIISQVSKSLSLRLAASQALWELVNANVIVPSAMTVGGGSIRSYAVPVPYQVDTGSGGQGRDLHFHEVPISAPAEVMLAPTQRFEPTYNLSDADLFLNELGIPGLNPLIAEALRDAIGCFDNDLYTPCLAMLTKAVEGAWTELGLALADAMPQEKAPRADALRNNLLDEQYSLARRIARVTSFYEDRDLCEGIWQASRITKDGIRQVAIWSNLVRDSRNVVHYLYTPTLKSTYENVVTLLIATLPNLRTMYEARAAAAAIATSRQDTP